DEVPERRMRPPVVVLSADAQYLAAAGRRHVAVWHRPSGRVLKVVARAATALALSPDGSLLAVGQADGQIKVYNLHGAGTATVLIGYGHEVTALTFCPEVRRSGLGPQSPWGLVAGDAGSLIAVYDLTTTQPQAFCKGTGFQVETLAVSP